MRGLSHRGVAVGLLSAAAGLLGGCGTSGPVVVRSESPPPALAAHGVATDLDLAFRLPSGAHVVASGLRPPPIGDSATPLVAPGTLIVSLATSARLTFLPLNSPAGETLQSALVSAVATLRKRYTSLVAGRSAPLTVDGAPAIGVPFTLRAAEGGAEHGEIILTRLGGRTDAISLVTRDGLALPLQTVVHATRWVRPDSPGQAVWLFEHLVLADRTLSACRLLAPQVQAQFNALPHALGVGRNPAAFLGRLEGGLAGQPGARCSALLSLYNLVGAIDRLTGPLHRAVHEGLIRARQADGGWTITQLPLVAQ